MRIPSTRRKRLLAAGIAATLSAGVTLSSGSVASADITALTGSLSTGSLSTGSLSTGSLPSGSVTPSGDIAAILDETLSSHNIPGAQVVHRRGDSTFNYTYGVQSAATGVPVNDETLFHVASLSKVVGSYVFMKRVDEGVIDLDTPLWNYYQSPRIANSEAAKTVTARMVLNHTTGFPNWAGASGSETTELAPTKAAPGTAFGYSGDGFFLLQTTLEHLEGKTFTEILDDEVFGPFGMTNSTLQSRAEDAGRTVVGHNADGVAQPMNFYPRGNTAYTLQTTALDYTTFLQRAVIDGEGLSPEIHDLWLATSSDGDRDPTNPANPYISWGLGIGIEDNDLGTAYWHWGDNGTRKAFFMTFPDRDESVVMTWNSANGQLSANDILKAFYGDEEFHAITWVG
ncbi:serine hydrolase [Rhodococcus hoagii]|nr:serine hydrolase [Prescottella equi]